MGTEPVTIRLRKEDMKYIEEYVAQLGMKKAPFLQSLLVEQLARLRKEPLPKQAQEKVLKKEEPAPAPNRTSFWRNYRAEMKSYSNPALLLSHPHILMKLLEETADELEAHAKEFPQTYLACIRLKLRILRDAQNISNEFETAKTDAEKNTVFRDEVRRRLSQLSGYQLYELVERYKRGVHPDRLLDG